MQDSSSPEPVLELALAQAQKALFISPPNPAVGCVLVSATGSVLGQGHTQPSGGPHAEVMALRAAAAKGLSVFGATAYVTLEPCAHFGRTPPCCHALIDAKIGKVVVAVLDPNPLVAGKGVELLRAAGVAVEVLDAAHPQAIAAKELMLGFFSRMVRQTPWVRLKIAASLDGKTALENGQSQWITSPEARADGQLWRARAGAILTGVGTVLADNPSLDVRLPNAARPSSDAQPSAVLRQPHLLILDSQLRTPPSAKVFAPNTIAAQETHPKHRDILIYTHSTDGNKIAALEAMGANVIHLPKTQQNHRIDLAALLRDLAQREVNELHVEAGATLNGALMDAGLVDELLVYVAPKLLGPGKGMLDTQALSSLNQVVPMKFTALTQVGEDLRLLLRVSGRDTF